jgi:hypothetical protein
LKNRQNKREAGFSGACPPFSVAGQLHEFKSKEGFRRMNIDNAMLINGGTMLLAIGGLALAMGQRAIFFILAAAGLAAYAVVLLRRFKR